MEESDYIVGIEKWGYIVPSKAWKTWHFWGFEWVSRDKKLCVSCVWTLGTAALRARLSLLFWVESGETVWSVVRFRQNWKICRFISSNRFCWLINNSNVLYVMFVMSGIFTVFNFIKNNYITVHNSTHLGHRSG